MKNVDISVARAENFMFGSSASDNGSGIRVGYNAQGN